MTDKLDDATNKAVKVFNLLSIIKAIWAFFRKGKKDDGKKE